jgi:D-beta-D-heptose 7-phosphate kinase/D-beta-D-heptose 1-phosphate adenosyltransferase
MAKTKTLVIASGYFNPIHEGHLEYLNRSKTLGDFLFVIVNNDYQRKLKGSKEFLSQEQRRIIVKNLKAVDDVIISIDENKLVNKTIELIYKEEAYKYDRILFTNGGDQTEETIGEKEICEKLGIEMVFGMGNKIQSSSWLLNKL